MWACQLRLVEDDLHAVVVGRVAWSSAGCSYAVLHVTRVGAGMCCSGCSQPYVIWRRGLRLDTLQAYGAEHKVEPGLHEG